MSTLGGIYNFDGRPIVPEILNSLSKGLAARGPDGGREVRLGAVGMTYQAFHTNRESRLEQQPLVSPHGQMLAWNGRLDNREELLAQLRDELRGDQTDVAIVMAAYQKWGIDFLPRLIGDFALSLWDPITQTLLLARDPAGTRTLFYHSDKYRCLWSSELAALLDIAEIGLEVNEEYVADYLVGAPETRLTPYKDIHAVPPAHVIIIRNGQLQTQRFWGLNPNYEIRYKSDAEYEEHFLHLFREAVSCRLRADGPVWAELSGGLDSSSIVCMADDVISKGEAQASCLETISYVFDESPTSDEREFIFSVEGQRKKAGHHLREEEYRFMASIRGEYFLSIPNPIFFSAELHGGLRNIMQAGGARVILSGKGGDEILCSSPDPSPELADLLIQFRLWRLHRRLRVWSREHRKPYLGLLLQGAIVPILPRRIQIAGIRYPSERVPTLFNQDFVIRMNIKDRMLGKTDILGFRLPSGRDQAIGFLSVVKHISTGSRQEVSDIEVSYPYLHRPLVEFMQGIPFEQKVRPGETRSLTRRALQNLLPEKIMKRMSKGHPGEVALRAMGRELATIRLTFKNARVCTRGYIDAEALLTAVTRLKHGYVESSLYLNRILALEFWLRALEYRSSMAKNAAAAIETPALQSPAA